MPAKVSPPTSAPIAVPSAPMPNAASILGPAWRTEPRSTPSRISTTPMLTPRPIRSWYAADSPGSTPVFDSSMPMRIPTRAAPRDRNSVKRASRPNATRTMTASTRKTASGSEITTDLEVGNRSSDQRAVPAHGPQPATKEAPQPSGCGASPATRRAPTAGPSRPPIYV